MRLCEDSKSSTMYLILLLMTLLMTLSESQDEVKEEQKPSPVPSPSNPFSRPGGTILLPDAPSPTLYEAQSASSLGLQLSQGYSQMYGGMDSPALSYCKPSLPFSLFSLSITPSLLVKSPGCPSLSASCFCFLHVHCCHCIFLLKCSFIFSLLSYCLSVRGHVFSELVVHSLYFFSFSYQWTPRVTPSMGAG